MAFLVLPLVSSTIIVSDDMDSVYNIEDEVEIDFSIERQRYIRDYVDVFLVCDDDLLVKRDSIEIEEDESVNFSYSFPATIKGDCFVKIEFGDESAKTEEFKVSDNIDINYNINNVVFYPGDKIEINGSAVKDNGNRLDGYVHISADKLINKTYNIDKGDFSFQHVIDDSTPTGDYDIVLEAYEKNINEEVINKGIEEKEIEVKPVASFIRIFTNESVKPYYNASIVAFVYDQGDKKMDNKSVLIKIFNPDRDIVLEKRYDGGDYFNYVFESNARQGFWEINAYHGSVFSKHPVYVL